MSSLLRFVDADSRSDLQTLLERLAQVGQPEVRLVSRGATLAVFGCTQAPVGLTDRTSVVLVMRGFELVEQPNQGIDVTVQVRALLDRLARVGRADESLDVPEVVVAAAWAGVLPPIGGWKAEGMVDAQSLVNVAQQGAARVAELLPDQPGDALVRTVRGQVWGVEVLPGVPAGAAFAADALGFLRDETYASLATSHTWVKLSTGRGQVLVRSRLGDSLGPNISSK